MTIVLSAESMVLEETELRTRCNCRAHSREPGVLHHELPHIASFQERLLLP